MIMHDLKQIIGDRDRMSEISHCIAGVIYYIVTVGESKYIFPVDMNDKADVGLATFNNQEKAIVLMRYIRKAMENDSLIKIK